MRLIPLLLALMSPVALATTVPPMTEAAQREQAAVILRARVESIAAARETTAGRSAIVTTVRFVPLAVYKGQAPGTLSLRFLGGRLDDMEMKVGAMPDFAEGAEYVLFVSPEIGAACPLVGWRDGALPVNRSLDPAGVVELPSGEGDAIVIAASRTVLTEPLPLAEFERRLRATLPP